MTDLYYGRVLDDELVVEFDNEQIRVKFKDGRFQGVWQILSGGRVQSKQIFAYGYDGGHSRFGRESLCQFKFYRFIKRFDFPNPKSEFLQPPHGDNLLAVVMTRKRLRGVVKDIFGKFGYRTVFRPQEGKIDIQKELEDVLFSFPYSLASETLQRLVFYLAAIYSNKDSILAFEEPEAHAFPYYTKYLAERIALDENNNQYFIATHNPYFLTAILEKAPKEEVEIFATRLENYQTRGIALAEEQKREILSDMGYDVFFNIKQFLN